MFSVYANKRLKASNDYIEYSEKLVRMYNSATLMPSWEALAKNIVNYMRIYARKQEEKNVCKN